MRPSRFAEEQIIGMLKEQEAGAKTSEVCRKHGISAATFYKFKAKFGGMDVSDARRQIELIRTAWRDSSKVYGYRKLHDDLVDMGENCCPNRVARL
ncbi:transposase, partial [Phreatobacter sp. HK31-P]